jgi:hypothetical protein
MFEFALEAKVVLRPLVVGRTVNLAVLADTAGLDLEGVAGLVQELVAVQAATVGHLLCAHRQGWATGHWGSLRFCGPSTEAEPCEWASAVREQGKLQEVGLIHGGTTYAGGDALGQFYRGGRFRSVGAY